MKKRPWNSDAELDDAKADDMERYDPKRNAGPSADGAADLASTDMSAEPSSRAGEAPIRADGAPPEARGGVPAEPAPEAVHRLEEAVAAAEDRYLRLAAEYDNFRKRTARERAELHSRAQVALVDHLLEVLDDMDRLMAAGPDASAEALRAAAALTGRKLHKELEAAGLERIDPAGAPFDPTLHEAVSTLPAPSAGQDHLVSATFQAGYRFNGVLVRPARVQVYSVQV